MSFLNRIISVERNDIYRIINILGIKFKSLRKNKIIKDILRQNNELKINFDNKISIINESISSFNKNYKFQFLKDNINNPIYNSQMLELYNFFEMKESLTFYKIFQYRQNFSLLKQELENLIKRSKKIPYILTDFQDFPSEYTIITKDEIKNHKNEDCIFIPLFNKDYLAIEVIEILQNYNLKYYVPIVTQPIARYFHIDENAFETLADEESSAQSHFCPVDFENIFQSLNICRNLEGDYVEIGTFKGDSASAVLNYMKRSNINKKAYFFDTFEGFDYEEAYNSQDGYWQNTHKNTSYEKVKKRLEKYEQAHIIKTNIIRDELPKDIEKICVANVDVDMYEAVKAALYKVRDKIVKHGIIIAEDFGHTPALIGAQKATREFLEENSEMFIPIYMASGQMFLIKK